MPDTTQASSRRVAFALSAVVVLLMIAGAVSFVLYARRHAPNPTLLVVAPFDIFVAELDGWRVGLAEGLTRRLAEPPYSTVPQAVVAASWRSAPTPAVSALEVARRAGAGIALYGRVDSLGADSVRVTVIAIESGSARILFGVQLPRGATDPEGLAAALAVQVRARLVSPT